MNKLANPTPSRTPLWLTQRAQMTPDQPALRFHDEEISFATLSARAMARAKALRHLGLRRGDVLAVLLPNGPTFVELLHAASYCGAVFLPLNTRLTSEELAPILGDAGPRLFLCEGNRLKEHALDALQQLDFNLPVAEITDDDPLDLVADARPWPKEDASLQTHFDAEDVFLLLYTSGTTGTPKGVPLAYANFEAAVMGSNAATGALPGDCWLACMPLFHIGGLSILLRSVLTGMCVHLQERFDAQALARTLDEGKVTLLSLVPTMLERLLYYRGDSPAPPALRALLLGGGPIPASLLARARALGYPVLPSYGLTEACSQVATLPLAQVERITETGPKPLLGIELRIVDETDRELPQGVEGEIVLRGPTLLREYWGQPEASREAFRGGWFHTGDIGLLRADGSLTVLDRRSDLIVSGGENVYPSEIESVLLYHPEIQDAAVVGEADEEFGQRVAAWVIREPHTRVSEEDIQEYCREHLAGFKIPRRVYFVENFQRNGAGKVLRNLLGKNEAPRSNASTNTSSPTSTHRPSRTK